MSASAALELLEPAKAGSGAACIAGWLPAARMAASGPAALPTLLCPAAAL